MKADPLKAVPPRPAHRQSALTRSQTRRIATLAAKTAPLTL